MDFVETVGEDVVVENLDVAFGVGKEENFGFEDEVVVRG